MQIIFSKSSSCSTLDRAEGREVRMEFVTDALGRFPGFEIEVTQVPCVLRDDIDGGDLPTLFYPGDSYGAPTAPVVTSRPVLLDMGIQHFANLQGSAGHLDSMSNYLSG